MIFLKDKDSLKNLCLDQLIILDSLDKKKIKIFSHSLRELNRLRSVSVNENPSQWFKENTSSLKICMLNCAGLRCHIKDIRNDPCLMKANIMHFVETSLEKNSTVDDLQIDRYLSNFLKISRGKGITTFLQGNSLTFEKNFVEHGIQVMKYTSFDLTLVAVYRSQNGNIGTLLEFLSDIFEERKAVLITGDFNICNEKKPNNAVKTTLLEKGFKLLMNEFTQNLGGFIDHAYWRDSQKFYENPSIERYSPYFSDHDALCISLKKIE